MQNKTLLLELFQAYYDCRKNKRNTINALQFELNYESNIITLRQEILSGTYEVGKSIAFIVNKPVKREIFAGDFRDRIVHHYLINKLNPLFEKKFIFDSYSCRIGKGTLFGVRRIEKFIRSCSQKYTKDCYILKLDIEGFFMNIDKTILYEKLSGFIENKYLFPDKNLLRELTKKVIFNDSVQNCLIKGDKQDWQGLPKSKSLFFAKKDTGLPIGNLTSQIFANFYLDSLDTYIKQKLKIKYYGRYVDDFVLVHPEKDYLLFAKTQIEYFLKHSLQLTLHPRKVYLQHFQKGVLFLGSFVLPYRKYLKNKTKGNIYETINILNQKIRTNNGKITPVLTQEFRQSINSYLGLMKHNDSYILRKKTLFDTVGVYFWNYFYISSNYAKVKVRQRRG